MLPEIKYFNATGDLWNYERIVEISADIVGMFLETFTESPYLPRTPTGRQLYLQHRLQRGELPPRVQALDVLDVVANPEYVPITSEIVIRRYGVSLGFENIGDLIDDEGERFSLMACSYDDKGIWNSDGRRYQEPLNVENEPTLSLATRPFRRSPQTILEVAENKLRLLIPRLQEIDGITVSTFEYPRAVEDVMKTFNSYVIDFDRRFWLRRGEVQVKLYYQDYEDFMKELEELKEN